MKKLHGICAIEELYSVQEMKEIVVLRSVRGILRFLNNQTEFAAPHACFNFKLMIWSISSLFFSVRIP